MSQSLVTIATYWNPTEARLARMYLEAEGIRSLLQNEHSVTMNWLEIANASRGVQLQVDPADVDAAMEVLERKSLQTEEIGDEWDTPPETTSEEDEEPTAEATPPAPVRPEVDDEKYAPLNMREQRIKRAFVTSIVGLLFLPLEFYSTYLLGVSLISEEPVRPSLRQTARQAALINGAVLLAYFLFAWQSGQYGLEPFQEIYYTFFGE